MYEGFYGLTRTPFAVTPDPAMLFMSKVHREALATIIYGVETRKGFIVCTGEVGTGKSTIIRAFFDQTLADAVKLIYIFTPQVTPLEIAKYICREMEMDEPDSIFAAVPRLQMKLLGMFEAGKTVVLMIDEAQLLPPETLEFLRLLSNFETDTEKLIQIVLVGQPEVDTVLARRDMRQVNQRVALRARLAPLSVEESFEYIDHRIRVSGAAEMAQVMSPSAAWLIAEAAGGIPRVINILSDNVMITGFGAAQRPIGSHLAGKTVREFLNKSGPAKPASGQRLGTGWRAAMRLRSALVREKEETEDWVSSSPVAISKPPRAPEPPPVVFTSAPLAPAPPLPEPTLPEPPLAEPGLPEPPLPEPPPPEPARVEALPPFRPVFVEPVAQVVPVRPPPVAPTPPESSAQASEVVWEPAPPAAKPVHQTPARLPLTSPTPIFVEPTVEVPIEGFGFGVPVSVEELIMVAPTAESDPPTLPPAPLPMTAQPAAVMQPEAAPPLIPALIPGPPPPVAPPPRAIAPLPPEPIAPAPAAEPAPPVAEPVAPRNRPSISQRRYIPPPLPRPYSNRAHTPPSGSAPANQPPQWPALSRIRSGLPPPPRGWPER